MSKYGPHTHFNYNPIALSSPFIIFRLTYTMFGSWEVWKNVLIVWLYYNLLFSYLTTTTFTMIH